jgi:hypothetical protein
MIMIFRSATPDVPVPKTVTLADGQTFDLLTVRPSYTQRFNDEGRLLHARASADGDQWSSLRLGRIRDAIVGWSGVTNDKGQEVPFTAARLLQVLDACPETVDQVVAIANEAFAPLEIPAPKAGVSAPPASGADAPKVTTTTTSTTTSDSTATTATPPSSPAASVSPPVS